MTYNVQELTIIILIPLFLGAGITYALTNKTIEQQIEEQNTAILQDCLSKARVKEVPSEILESASHCNKDLLKTIYSPLYSRTGSEINCPELYESWNTIESPRQWVTFIFTKEEVKELYPNCKIWTHSTGNTVPPLWFQLIPQASAKSVEIKNDSANGVVQNSYIDAIGIQSPNKIRTPKQIYEQVKHLGYRETPTISLIKACKASSLHPEHCVLIWLVLMYNEAGNHQNSKACTDRKNCFGINSWKKVYASLDEWMENWVQKYNRYWYKAESPSFFYSSAWKLSPSRYCVSEESSNTEIGCPRWLMIATTKWKQLKLILNNGK